MKKIYLSPPFVGNEEIQNSTTALQSGWVTTQGAYSDEFTFALENHFKKPVLLTNSGTSAIHLALIHSGISEGDYVLCSNFSFAASAFPILYQKAIPVFIGVEDSDWNLSPDFLEEALLSLKKRNKKPKALILVHVYGNPANIKKIQSICQRESILLIEDAAEALGSQYNAQAVGSFGEFGIISFNGNKIITTSSGGALICAHSTQKEHAFKTASQSKENLPYYSHNSVGYNYLQSNILASIGGAQFQKLPTFVKRRREIFQNYVSEFSEFIPIHFQKEHQEGFSNRWLSSFYSENITTEALKEQLNLHGIESRHLFYPLHLNKAFSGAEYVGNLHELNWFTKGISLPSGNQLTDSEQEYIIKTFKKVIKP